MERKNVIKKRNGERGREKEAKAGKRERTGNQRGNEMRCGSHLSKVQWRSDSFI